MAFPSLRVEQLETSSDQNSLHLKSDDHLKIPIEHDGNPMIVSLKSCCLNGGELH